MDLLFTVHQIFQQQKILFVCYCIGVVELDMEYPEGTLVR
jgi:hypothetical protein